MAFYITQLHDIDSMINNRQQAVVAQVAQLMGIPAIGLRKYAEEQNELEQMVFDLLATLKPVKNGEGLIVQLPTGNGPLFDNILLDQLAKMKEGWADKKLLVFFHQAIFDQANELSKHLKLINQAHALLVPNEIDQAILQQLGIAKEKIICYRLLDAVNNVNFGRPAQNHHYINAFGATVDDLIDDWTFNDVPLHIYNSNRVVTNPACSNKGNLSYDSLVLSLHRAGGFGYVSNNRELPFELGHYLSAALPVIVEKGNPQADWVKKYGLGYVVSSPAMAVAKVKETSDDDYQHLTSRVAQMGALSRQGYFIRQALAQGQYQAMLAGIGTE